MQTNVAPCCGTTTQKSSCSSKQRVYFFVMIPFLIAGGSVLTTLVTPDPVDTMNHTLLGAKVKAKEVVCRNMWGTPMMPDGKGSYSLIAAPDPVLIERSLIQPPKTDSPIFVPGQPYKLPSMVSEPEKLPVPAELLPAVQQPLALQTSAPVDQPSTTAKAGEQ